MRAADSDTANRLLLLAAWGMLALAGSGHAAEVTFSLRIEGEERVVRAESVYIQGLPHVDLAALSTAVGATCRVRPTQVQVDLGGNSALVGLNDVQVYASQRGFALRHPIVRHQDGVYIELLDAQTLFSEAFGVPLVPADVARTPRREEPPDPAPAAPSAPAPGQGLGTLEPLDPVEANLFEASSLPAPAPEPIPVAELFEAVDLPGAPVSGGYARIVLDPGHGGRDRGCEGTNGTVEKDLCLKLGLALRSQLEETGRFQVFLTRDADVETTARMRTTFANTQNGDLFLSLHAAASPATQAHGIVAFCPPPAGTIDAVPGGAAPRQARDELHADTAKSRESQRIAEAMLGAVREAAGVDAARLSTAPVQVLRQAKMPGVLFEVGFLSNPAEEALLATDDYLGKLAAGMAAGIVQATEGAAQ